MVGLGLSPTESSKCIRSGKAVRVFTHVLNKCLNSSASGNTVRKSVSDVVYVKVYRPWTAKARNERAGFGGALALAH